MFYLRPSIKDRINFHCLIYITEHIKFKKNNLQEWTFPQINVHYFTFILRFGPWTTSVRPVPLSMLQQKITYVSTSVVDQAVRWRGAGGAKPHTFLPKSYCVTSSRCHHDVIFGQRTPCCRWLAKKSGPERDKKLSRYFLLSLLTIDGNTYQP